jgi:hypothetical protein
MVMGVDEKRNDAVAELGVANPEILEALGG